MEVFPPGTVWEYYGASEGMCTVISPEEWLRKPGSVGRAFPGLRDHDPRRRRQRAAAGRGRLGVHVGDAGDAEVRVPQRAREDRRRRGGATSSPCATSGRSTRTATCSWPTGGVDLILRGGVNIYPAEVGARAGDESPTWSTPRSSGCPTSSSASACTPIVELRPGAAAGSRRHPRAAATGQLAPYKLPTTIEFIDELPREPNGKVLKRQLRDARLARRDLTGADAQHPRL